MKRNYFLDQLRRQDYQKYLEIINWLATFYKMERMVRDSIYDEVLKYSYNENQYYGYEDLSIIFNKKSKTSIVRIIEKINKEAENLIIKIKK